MKPWQRDFIRGLRRGVSEGYLAKTLAGLPLAVVQAMREEDIEFGQAWDEVLQESLSHIDQRALSAQLLERVLHAQMGDDRAAAYFGMPVDEFRETINADPVLSRVYKFAREAGLAIAEINTFQEMTNGNWQAAQHFAKHKLGQVDGAAGQSGPVVVNFNMLDPGASYRQLLGGGMLALEDVIEGEVVKE